MYRTLLCGALAATTLAFATPASAESAIEFLQKEAAEKAPAKSVSRTSAKVDRKAKTERADRKEREELREGRASASTEALPRGGNLASLVQHYAAKHGVPQHLAHGVVMVESRYRANATGPGGYIGLMQLSYRTAQGMGYKGSRKALYEPATNLDYGMRYLAEANRQAGGNMCGAVSKYQGGHGVRGVTKAGAVYCGKVKKYMAQKAPSYAAPVQVAENEKSRS